MLDMQLSTEARQGLISLVLMVEEASNSDLRQRFGVAITKPARLELAGHGLVTWRKGTRGVIFHELTDKGWACGRQELAEPAPAGAQPAKRLLYGALNQLSSYMAEHDVKMAEVFCLPGGSVDDVGNVEDRVRAAYRRLARRTGDLVSLARLRAEVPVDRQRLDGVLLDMHRRGLVQLEPDPNRQALPGEARQAALRVGGEDMHLLALVSR